MLDVVNTRIKFREPFSPFAPSVRAGDEGRYFDVPSGAEQPVDWMLCVCPTREAARDFATTHVDGSARCHTVREAANPLYHRLLCEVGERTGHPMVLNTSFNLKGEPIVSTPLDALATFRRCALDTLYVGNFRVTRGDREPPAE